MMRLEEWALVTKSRGTFVTLEMIKNRELHIQRVVFIGKFPESENLEERKKFKSAIVKKINKKRVITEAGEFILGAPSKEYAEFVEAMKQGLPIIINWVIGKNNMLSANVYENGQVSYLCEMVVAQNLAKRTLLLANGKTVYVVWRNINNKMVRHLLTIKEWMDLHSLFPTKNFPFQMDVFQTSQKIWMYKTIPYEWIFNSPHNFSILNEDIRTIKKQKSSCANLLPLERGWMAC